MENKFKNIPHLNIYQKSNIPQRYHFTNENTGDFLIVADPGWLVFTQEEFDKTTMLNIKGMHGWDPLDKEMHGIFMASGPDIKKGEKIESFENIYVNGLITKLIGIKPYLRHHQQDGAYYNNEIVEKILY